MSTQKRSNQHIKRRERAEAAEFARRKIRAGILISRLNRAAKGKLELSKGQLEATKILLDKALPSLQAVEYRQEEQPQTPEEIEAQLRSLLADPGLRAQLKSMLQGSPEPVDTPLDVVGERTVVSKG